MSKCSEGQDIAIPCSVLVLLVFNHSQTYSELSSQFCPSVAFYHFFSQMEILPWHTLQGRKGASQGFGCLQHSPSGLEQVKHQGAGHSSVCPNLMGISLLPKKLLPS